LAKLAPPTRPAARLSATEESPEEESPLRRVVPEKRKPRLVDEMQEAAKAQPEEIAKVVRTIMNE